MRLEDKHKENGGKNQAYARIGVYFMVRVEIGLFTNLFWLIFDVCRI